MDYSVDLYPKIPFYMTYPMQNMYLTEMEYEKDIERMKNYYPEKTKDIMKLVEERLDELAYEGSRIYEKEPDQAVPSYFEMVPMALAGQQRRPPQRDCRDDWLCSMVGVLFGTELYRRRCHHRRCRRWW